MTMYRFLRARLCAALLIQISGNRITDSGTLKNLIMDAYKVKAFQIFGLAESSHVHQIAIQAKGEPTIDEARQMLQGFLADRFHLKLHRETRELPVYVLVAGTYGTRLTPIKSSKTCAASGGGGKGGRASSAGTLPQSWESTVALLSDLAGRTVIDRTGLHGNYCALYGQDPLAALGSAASIFTQIEEKWGVKLETQTAPIEVLVVDHSADIISIPFPF